MSIQPTSLLSVQSQLPRSAPFPAPAGEGLHLVQLKPAGACRRESQTVGGHAIRVASTGERRDARHAGTSTADWPSSNNATTPATT
jgi:hypothetical protein